MEQSAVDPFGKDFPAVPGDLLEEPRRHPERGTIHAGR